MTPDPHTLTGAYSLNATDDGEAVAFETHLAACPSCQDEVRGLQAAAARLGDAVAEAPPSALRERVLSEARRTPQETPPETVTSISSRAGRRPSAPGRWLAVAAAVLLLVAGAAGAVAYESNQRANSLAVAADQLNQLLSQPDVTTQQSAVSGGGEATLVSSRSAGDAVLLTSDVPATDSSSTYQLWSIDESGATSVGLFNPGSDSRGAARVELPATTITFGMTVEPAGGSPAPTTEPILLIDVAT